MNKDIDSFFRKTLADPDRRAYLLALLEDEGYLEHLTENQIKERKAAESEELKA